MNQLLTNSYKAIAEKIKKTPSHLYVAASAWICNFVLAGLQLIIIPILSSALGADHFAVFVIISNLVVWLNLSDLSLGYSLQNFISEHRARKENYDNYIFNTIFLGFILIVAMFTIIFFAAPFLANALLAKFDFLTSQDKTNIFMYATSCLAVTGVSAIGYKIWFAEHKGYFSNTIPAIAIIISFSLIYSFVNQINENRLFWSLIIYIAPTAFMGFLVLSGRFVSVFKKGCSLSLEIIRKLSKRAFSFWGFYFMSTITLQLDYIIMSQTLKPKEIVIYNITFRIFNLMFVVYTAILAALWPIFSESITANNWEKVIKYIKKYLFQGISSMILATTGMCFLMPHIAKILVPSERLHVPVIFIILLGTYFILRIWTDTFSMVLSSMSKLKIFWFFVPIQALISVPGQWFFSTKIGLYGIPLGLIVSFILTSSWIVPFTAYKYMKKSQASLQGA